MYNILRVLITFSFTVIFFSCEREDRLVTASGQILNNSGEVLGSVFASQLEESVVLTVNLANDEPNRIRAVHIHNGTCESPLGHWNSQSSNKFCDVLSMGRPWSKPYAGDIGNINTGVDGQGSITIETDLWTINKDKPTDIDGKIVAVHLLASHFDVECDPDHETDHTHENPKIGCGLIALDQ